MEIQTFIGTLNFDSLVNEFTEIGPIFEIAGAAVDLVYDDAIGLALPQ